MSCIGRRAGVEPALCILHYVLKSCFSEVMQECHFPCFGLGRLSHVCYEHVCNTIIKIQISVKKQ